MGSFLLENQEIEERKSTLPLPDHTAGPTERQDGSDSLHWHIEPVAELIGTLCSLKSKLGCDYDDLLIALACATINLSYNRSNSIVLQPANINSIAEYLELSRETVRRRLHNLEYKDIVTRYPSGYVANLGPSFSRLFQQLRD